MTRIEWDQIDFADGKQEVINILTDVTEVPTGYVFTKDASGNAMFLPLDTLSNLDGGSAAALYSTNQHIDGGHA